MALGSSAQKDLQSNHKDRLEYRLFFGVAFLLFLIPSVLSRALPWTWFQRGGEGTRRSIFDESRARAAGIVPFVFMG